MAVYRPQPQPQQPRQLSPALFPADPVFPPALIRGGAPPVWRSWVDDRQDFYADRPTALYQRSALFPADPVFPAPLANVKIARIAFAEAPRARQPQTGVAALLPQADFPWAGIAVVRIAPPEPARGRASWPVTPAVFPPDPAYDFAFRATARIAPPEPARARVPWPGVPDVFPPDPAYDFAFRPVARIAPPEPARARVPWPDVPDVFPPDPAYDFVFRAMARVAPPEPVRGRQPQSGIAALLPQADFPWSGIAVARVVSPESARGRILWPVTPAVFPPDPAYDFVFRAVARIAPAEASRARQPQTAIAAWNVPPFVLPPAPLVWSFRSWQAPDAVRIVRPISAWLLVPASILVSSDPRYTVRMVARGFSGAQGAREFEVDLETRAFTGSASPRSFGTAGGARRFVVTLKAPRT